MREEYTGGHNDLVMDVQLDTATRIYSILNRVGYRWVGYCYLDILHPLQGWIQVGWILLLGYTPPSTGLDTGGLDTNTRIYSTLCRVGY